MSYETYEFITLFGNVLMLDEQYLVTIVAYYSPSLLQMDMCHIPLQGLRNDVQPSHYDIVYAS